MFSQPATKVPAHLATFKPICFFSLWAEHIFGPFIPEKTVKSVHASCYLWSCTGTGVILNDKFNYI